MNFRIWSVKEQKFLSYWDMVADRLALRPTKRVYSGKYDCEASPSDYLVDMGSGVKDSKGVEIFENDTVANQYGAIFLCVFDDKNGCFALIPVTPHPAYENEFYTMSEVGELTITKINGEG